MRRIIGLLLALCLIIALFTGCAKEPVINEIAPKELSEEQRDIVDLLSDSSREILLYDYSAQGAYTSAEFWVEIYRDGKLSDTVAGIKSYGDQPKAFSGQLAVSIEYRNGLRFSFVEARDGSRISSVGEYGEIYDPSLARAYGPISAPVEIVPGKEIVLYSTLYSNGSIRAFSDLQSYADDPGLLAEYPYAILIKCKFE